jgi:hypothetical protein
MMPGESGELKLDDFFADVERAASSGRTVISGAYAPKPGGLILGPMAADAVECAWVEGNDDLVRFLVARNNIDVNPVDSDHLSGA